MHPKHTAVLVDDALLEPRCVVVENPREPAMKINICRTCDDSLSNEKTQKPPWISLANGLWLGEVPIELKRLTLPERLLIARYFPRVYVFKLFPKKVNGKRDMTTLQSGFQGNVCSYEQNLEDVASIGQGRLTTTETCSLGVSHLAVPHRTRGAAKEVAP